MIGNITNNQGYNLTGLTPGTCINVYVQEVCGTTLGPWIGPLLICTPLDWDADLVAIHEPKNIECG
ncbi:hypothetical protein RZS08_42800, partial [Arthrospira platensis SPKY1]|nr:hypothetical protein [Arthrospira platensis SPKY1]